jgi:hypothetical protein
MSKNFKPKLKRTYELDPENMFYELEEFLAEQYGIYLSDQDKKYNDDVNEIAREMGARRVEITEIDSGKKEKAGLIQKAKNAVKGTDDETPEVSSGLTRKVLVQVLEDGTRLEFKNSVATAKEASDFRMTAKEADEKEFGGQEQSMRYVMSLCNKPYEYYKKISDKDYPLLLVISNVLFV